jgi:hypothetical protein
MEDTPSPDLPVPGTSSRTSLGTSVPSTTSTAPDSEKDFTYLPHARTKAILEGALKPVRVMDQYPRGTRLQKLNAFLGVKITNAVGTMACAYVFTVIALISLPSAIKSANVIVIISWIAQTFLQLVLLSIIMVGQNVQAQAADLRSENTYKDAEAVLHESLQIQQHLESQDILLSQMLAQIDVLQKRVEKTA